MFKSFLKQSVYRRSSVIVESSPRQQIEIFNTHNQCIRRNFKTNCSNSILKTTSNITNMNEISSPDFPSNKTRLMGMSKDEMKQLLEKTHPHIASSFRLDEIYKFMYRFGARNFNDITVLSKADRQSLSELYSIDLVGNIEEEVLSKKDKHTRKFLFAFENPKFVKSENQLATNTTTCHNKGDADVDTKTISSTKKLPKQQKEFNKVEAVYIYHPPKATDSFGRGTVCLSSQVGCSLSCAFCRTGTAPIERNLLASEIVSQLVSIKHHLQDFPIYMSEEERKKATVEKALVNNIVFMGEGEPLYNYKNVQKACEILCDGCGISKRKIIVSTSGVCNLIPNVVNDLGVNLAISLHATTNEMRDQLVPLNKIFPLEVLFDTLREKCFKNNTRHITFEYVMLDHVNDFIDDAQRLVHLVKDIPCSVNLIAFNEWEGSGFNCSSHERIEEFSKFLYRNGIHAPIRHSKGQDILGACGQLKNRNENKNSVSIHLQKMQHVKASI
ncbi:hypothetical protein C9374_011144 [Naegleria lovaniensis]|uniref:Radical SAM core domain-containing protein n=1 Tax=Naegleria lovaniensis TaxID=51637 RepID=A0AA88GEN1_NAELO|nr:uncharacterized protein C9374_011144 [Naegleria lovaniensis]KAG2374065.1 hypothetical protein C9374_011144 [Naegleria lovaniensis]